MASSQRQLEVEAKYYKNWVNLKLKATDYRLNDIDVDFKTGVLTVQLAQQLLGKQLKHFPGARSEYQQVLNNNEALRALKEDGGCNFVGTDGSILTAGSSRMTRGFLWQLIFKFQVSVNGKNQAEMVQLSLKFIRETLASLSEDEVTRIRMLSGDFDNLNEPITCDGFHEKSWNDGLVLAGLCVGVDKTNSADTLHKLEQKCNEEKMTPTQPNGHMPAVALTHAAIITAEDSHQIPALIEADDLVHAFEPNSILSYISYYLRSNEKPVVPGAKSPAPPPLPVWDELEYLLTENRDKTTHNQESHITSSSQISIDMPTMQQLQTDLKKLEDMIQQFDTYCATNGQFEDNSPNALLFKRLHAHKARIDVDILNYLHSIEEIKALDNEKVTLENDKEVLATSLHMLELEHHNCANHIKELEEQLRVQQNENHQKDVKLNEVEAEIVLLRGKQEQNDTEMTKLKQDYDNSIKNNQELTTQLASTTALILANESEKESILTKLNDLKRERDQYKQENETLQAKVNDLEAELNKLRNELQQANDQITTLELQLQSKTDEMNELQGRYDKVVKNNEELIKELEKAKKEIEDMNHKCEIEHIAELATLSAKISLLEHEKNDLQAEIDDKDTQQGQNAVDNRRKDDEITALQKQIEQLKGQNDTNGTELAALIAKIALLEEQLQEHEKNSNDDKDTIKQLQDELAQLRAELDAEKAKNAELLTQIQLIEKERDESREEISKLNSEIETLKREKDESLLQLSSGGSEIADLSRQIADLTRQIADLTRQIAELMAQLKSKDDEIEQLKSQIVEKDTRITELESLLKAAEEHIVELEKSNNEKDTIITTLRQDIENNNNDITILRQDVENNKNEIEKQNDTISELNNQIQQLTTQLSQTQSESNQSNDADSKRIAELEEKVIELEQKIVDLEAQIKKLMEQQQKDRAQIQLLTTQLNDKDNEIIKLTTQLSDKDNEIIKLNDQMKSLQEQLAQQNGQITTLQIESEKVKPLQQMNIKLKKDGVEQKSLNEKLQQDLEVVQEQNKNDTETIEKLTKDLEVLKLAHDKYKKDNIELKKQLQDHKKKNPDGSCGCTCRDHEVKHDNNKDNKDPKKLQEELDAMKSKNAALQVEMAYQRQGNQKEIEELRTITKEQQLENDKLVGQIQRLQDKLKQEGKFNPDEDHVLSEAQINAAKVRDQLIQDALELLKQLQPQAGIVFSSQDPEDGGIKVTKVHIGKAAYVAGIVPAEIISTVDGQVVDKEKFAELWKNNAKAGSTLYLQVNGIDNNNKKYHRTVKMDLGSSVAAPHDVKALKRMSEGVIKKGDDVIYQRIKQAQDDHIAGNSTTQQNNKSDDRDINSKGYLDENDMEKSNPRASFASPRRSSTVPTPSKSTTTPSKPTTTPSRSTTTTPSRSTTTATTPSRSTTTPTRNSLTSAAPLLSSPRPTAKTRDSSSSIPVRPTASTPNRQPTTSSVSSTPRRTITPSSSLTSPKPTTAASPRTSINGTPTTRSAPPRGSQGPPAPLADSRLMLQRRAENEKLRREIADLDQ